jgi:hypothetical protein
VRDITEEEATHRLSFLADIVDTGGYAIKGASNSPMREDLVAEANAVSDMFESGRSNNLETAIERGETERHSEVVQGMKDAINRTDTLRSEEGRPLIQKRSDETTIDPSGNSRPKPVEPTSSVEKPDFNSPVVVLPGAPVVQKDEPAEEKPEKVTSAETNHSIMELANNPDFTVATIAKEANRINRKEKNGEIFVSLH